MSIDHIQFIMLTDKIVTSSTQPCDSSAYSATVHVHVSFDLRHHTNGKVFKTCLLDLLSRLCRIRMQCITVILHNVQLIRLEDLWYTRRIPVISNLYVDCLGSSWCLMTLLPARGMVPVALVSWSNSQILQA